MQHINNIQLVCDFYFWTPQTNTTENKLVQLITCKIYLA